MLYFFSMGKSRFVNSCYYSSAPDFECFSDSYPWWPAVIFEQDDPDVPGNILKGCLDAQEKRKLKLYILRFFDKNQSWCVQS